MEAKQTDSFGEELPDCGILDRTENHKTAPRQRPAPVEPVRVAAISASKGIRLFLMSRPGTASDSRPAGLPTKTTGPQVQQEQSTTDLKGEPMAPPCAFCRQRSTPFPMEASAPLLLAPRRRRSSVRSPQFPFCAAQVTALGHPVSTTAQLGLEPRIT